MFKFVLLVVVLIAGAACDNPCKKCFTDLGPFKCSMLEEVTTCLNKAVNCAALIHDIERGCSTEDYYVSVYKTIAGSGVDVYNSFMGIGDRSTWNLPNNCLVECKDFYRSDLMDLWESLPIKLVDFDVIDESKDVKSVSFDGRNTTRSNWFTAERLTSSPWDDLTKNNSYYFSIEGFAGIRRFYIAKKHSECCAEDGWLSIVEGQRWCYYAKADSYPKIIFSGLSGATRWSREYQESPSMEVWIGLTL